MTTFAFVAYGLPAPQGSKRHLGKGVMVESSKAVKPWREAVKSAALDALPRPWEPLDGPLAVRMVFTMPRPKSARKADFAPATRRNDCSKICRAVEDALTDAGVIVDDGLIVDYHRLAKVWWGFDDEALPMPGVLVAVTQILERGGGRVRSPSGGARDSRRRATAPARRMTRRAQPVIHHPRTHNGQTEWNGLVAGDAVKVTGLRGVFVFREYAVGAGGSEWVTVYGGSGGRASDRSVAPERVRAVKVKRGRGVPTEHG